MTAIETATSTGTDIALDAPAKDVFWPRLLFIPASALGVWAIAVGWPIDHWAVQTAWTIATAYCLFCASSCYHEAVHQTLHGSPRFSLWVGRFLSLILLVPYHVYREVHIRHHAYLNSPTDWEMWPYSDPSASLGFRRIFVWFDVFVGAVASAVIYNRIFIHPQSPIESPQTRATIRREYLGMILFWGGLLGAVGYFGAWSTFFWCWVLPLGMAGSFQSVRKLTEHLGMASYDPLLGTRTVICRDWPSRVMAFFHFDIFIHGVHHRHPRMMHNELKPTMLAYASTNPDVGQQVYPYYWMASLDMLPHLLNPGVGINVGGAPPRFKTREDSAQFVSDVTQEVLDDSRDDVASMPLSVCEAAQLTDDELRLLDHPPLATFQHYAAFATKRTIPFYVKVYRGGQLIGAAPVLKTVKYKGTRMLTDRSRWWLSLLIGPFARTTTYSIDTSLQSYEYASPFYCVDLRDRAAVKSCVAKHLQAKQDGDSVWISEPLAETAWTTDFDFDTFLILPMAHVDLSGYDNVAGYLAGLSKKRRKNMRQAQREFTAAGATIERLEGSLSEADLDEMCRLLRESARRSRFAVPIEDVLNDEQAFRTQPQRAIVARQDGRMIGFMSFTDDGEHLLQCHGGLDYDLSHASKSYHNLMLAAIEYALDQGFSRVSFGPLNNETKRRSAGQLMPVAANIWTRNRLFRPFTRKLVIPNMQVFVDWPEAGDDDSSSFA